MPSLLPGATCGWRRKVFHYRPPTPMYRNSPPLCTIELQIPSLMPLKMRKVQFIRGSSSPQVSKYAEATLRNIYTPKASRFLEVTEAFSEKWGELLKNYLDSGQGERRDAIDSIINNRHLIAHGKNTSISVVRVKNYLEKALEVIDFIEAQCK